jgi:hypothetical protein
MYEALFSPEIQEFARICESGDLDAFDSAERAFWTKYPSVYVFVQPEFIRLRGHAEYLAPEEEDL